MRLFLAVALLMSAFPAASQNWVGLLKNGPAERFDDEDLRIFMETARKALNEGADNQTASWENPKTKARGEVTVVRRYEWKKNPCRELKVHNEAQGRKGDSTFNLCQVEGKWRLLSSSQVPKKQP
jgi:surface antigen